MSWNGNNGGDNNPWGSGGGGRRPSGGGNQPPNIDDVIKKSQEQLKQAMPGGAGGISLIVIVAIGLWLLSGFYKVETNEQGVVLRFGEYVHTTSPGLHWHMPYPIETVFKPDVTAERQVLIGSTVPNTRRRGRSRASFSPDESLMLTGDENIIDIKFSVVWRIRTAENYLFKLSDPEQTVREVAQSAMREIVGKNNVQDLFTVARERVQRETLELVQNTLDLYEAGIEVVRVQISESDPPDQVVEAFRDVQRAKSDSEKFQNEAEAYRNTRVNAARGQASQMIQGAKAYDASVRAKAEGEAERFLSILREYRKEPDITRQRIYLETMEEILKGMDKTIVGTGKNGTGVVPYLPLNELKKGGK